MRFGFDLRFFGMAWVICGMKVCGIGDLWLGKDSCRPRAFVGSGSLLKRLFIRERTSGEQEFCGSSHLWVEEFLGEKS